MARSPRLLLSKSYYHIMTRGINRMVVFKDKADYGYYLQLIVRFKKELAFSLYHYCLMPNHVHLLIKTDDATDFSNFMKKINLAYYAYFNRKYGWIGHFWQNRYKSQPVGKDEYFIQCGKYIELNPVRAELVTDADTYRYSSFRYYSRGINNPILTVDPFFDNLSGSVDKRRESYRELVISEIVLGHYLDRVWGSEHQRHNESRKTQKGNMRFSKELRH